MRGGRARACALAFMCALAPGAGLARTAPALPSPIVAGTAWTPEDVASLRGDIDALLDNARTLRGAHVGLLALDASTGALLYARSADDAFVPASTMKLLTGSVALAKLGPAFTFTTQVLALPGAGPTRLVLRGGGDALLSAHDVDDAATAVAAAVPSVGAVQTDASLFDRFSYPQGWSWDDFPFDYAAPVSALCLEDNVVHIALRPGLSVGTPVQAEFTPASLVDIRIAAVTGAKESTDTLDVARESGQIVVTGSLPLGAASETIDAAVFDPERYAGDVLVRALARHGRPSATPGTTSADAAASEATVVWERHSAPLAAYLAKFWYPSDNLIGETLLKSLGVAHSGRPGSTASGAQLEREWLASIGVDPATISIADGSGLSDLNRMTPRALTAILQDDFARPYRSAVVDALPLAGVRGTLATAFVGTLAEGRVFAKTGSVSHARGIAGWLRPLHHGTVTFAFLVDDFMGVPADLTTLRAAVFSRMIASP